jgi:FtsZ-interacting cell division protein YlmF
MVLGLFGALVMVFEPKSYAELQQIITLLTNSFQGIHPNASQKLSDDMSAAVNKRA